MLRNEDDSYEIELETKRNYQFEFRKRKIAAYNNYMAEARHRSKLKSKVKSC